MTTRYDNTTILLHWLSAALLLALWALGQTIDWFPSGSPRVLARSLHISTGVLLTVLLVYRLFWRSHGGIKLPPAASGWQQTSAELLHKVLYLMLAVVLILGLFNTWVRGDNLFDLFRLPSFAPGDKALRHQVEDLHGLAANILLAMAACHAAAGLFHYFFLKDQVLQRMSWKK
ncbi:MULTISPECIES: cytochrome b [unclassified Undibacterium]|uniref:cytochrome b n=1 Tax=unclassified Undibacterium TaxID=2630295 RepID=UPI002AC94FCF|nr:MULTISPECIES: cytochrome b/b6 domain-containing protein [unclassified Undibacterium]MEB0139278.1 cytochrome b/b6 domain-containing protein [Undibacterium sp. CCC2.1]MEB0172122.1 cytochrome b/b6 domain-containing protein [Undibacterium sp. CCC1.1]MEB0175997.1 cytochrome b/b6 domain-containing protein [Undibacterium sp. CCC3.4]MEB0215309.1 cytochrome b/b6 domain-containing protein [Undibacterium sp. 5I2]WPX45483.1 cytochrome b/b6 domain-containing protein [Undibacterium sp. CCC3.4]